MEILLQSENHTEVKRFIKKHGISFVRWINSHSGHELAKTKDGKMIEIKFTYRDKNPLNRIYNITSTTLTN